MALPTAVKNWQFIVNQYHTTEFNWVTDYKQMYWAWKEAFLGRAAFNANGVVLPVGQGSWNTHWTVVGSSDGSAYGMDGVDRWTNYTKLVSYPSSNGTTWGQPWGRWLVLANTAMGVQICIALMNDYTDDRPERGPAILVTVGGAFTGGTLSARPTATSEYAVMTKADQHLGGKQDNFGSSVHFIESQDGESTRIILCSNNHSIRLIAFEKQQNPPPELANPHIFWAYSANDSPLSHSWLRYEDYNDAARVIGKHSDWYSAYMTSEGFANAATGKQCQTVHGLGSYGYSMYPIGLWAGGAVNGRLGTLYDLYWGPNGRLDGSTYPANGDRKWIQFGNLIFPWTGLNVAPGLVPQMNA